MDNKQNVTKDSKEVYVVPKAEIMTVELDQSILQASASLQDHIEQGDNVFTPVP